MSDSTQKTDSDLVFPEDDFSSSSNSTEQVSQPAETRPVEENISKKDVAQHVDDSEPISSDSTAKDNQPDEIEDSSLDVSTPAASFKDFCFSDELMQGITEAGFTEPTPIQLKAMPEVQAGHDIIGQALTGSGKTAAFGLPVIDKIRHQDGLNFLVLVPTRELATQVSGELFRLGRYTGLKTAAFTGGQSYSRQESMLNHGINALVATPGRLIDLIKSGHFKDINPPHIVVDEADEMLDMGFIEDVRTIFATFPGPRQTMLFSATMPKPVVELAEEILNDPVNITTSIQESANNDIEQLFFVIEESERANAVIRLIDAEDVTKAMIFCRTKEETDALNILLSGRGYNVNCLHGDMEQAQRSRVMNAFRRGEIDILVATDVAARGLDVDDVTHVFNYHLPFDSRGYVHRIGRTGRAGKAGTAITLVTPREMRQLDTIRKTVGAQIENRLVPTRTEVTEMRLKKIFRALNEVELDVNLLNQVQTLTTNQDLEVLIAKLVAHELSNGGDTGPEHIGIGGQRLAKLLTPKSRSERRRFDDDESDGFGRRRRGHSDRRREDSSPRDRRSRREASRRDGRDGHSRDDSFVEAHDKGDVHDTHPNTTSFFDSAVNSIKKDDSSFDSSPKGVFSSHEGSGSPDKKERMEVFKTDEREERKSRWEDRESDGYRRDERKPSWEDKESDGYRRDERKPSWEDKESDGYRRVERMKRRDHDESSRGSKRDEYKPHKDRSDRPRNVERTDDGVEDFRPKRKEKSYRRDFDSAKPSHSSDFKKSRSSKHVERDFVPSKKDKDDKRGKDRKKDKGFRDVPPPPPSNWYFN